MIRTSAAVAILVGVVTVVASPKPAEAATTPYTLSVFAGAGTSTVPIPGQATSSPMAPSGVAVDAAGNRYIADHNGYVEKVTPAGSLSIIAGNGTLGAPVAGPATSSPMRPTAVAVDASGAVYVADTSGYVAKIDASGTLSIIAGNGSLGRPVAGPATSSPLYPFGVAVDASGNVYVADDTGGYVVRVSPSGMLSIIAGTGGGSAPVAGPATSSPLYPQGVAVDASGNVYVADYYGYVEKVTPAGMLSIIAGTGGSSAPVAGPATSSPMRPAGVAVDASGNVYIADGTGHVEQVSASGTLSIIAGNGNPNRNSGPVAGPATLSPMIPSGVAVDASGDLYIADDVMNYVEEVTPTGMLSVIAGDGKRTRDPVAGPAASSPMNPTGLAEDHVGNLYEADRNGYVTKVTPSGVLSILAGNGDNSGADPVAGPATSSPMRPRSIAVDPSGDVYIADGDGYLEKVTPAGTLSVIAGNGTSGAPVAGPATSSSVGPDGLAVDSSGDVYVADYWRGDVEKVTSSGTLSIFAGTGISTYAGPPAPGPATSSVIRPLGVAVDASDNVYVADGNGYVEKVTPSGSLSVIAGDNTSGPAEPTGVAVDAAGTAYVADALTHKVEKVTASGALWVIGGNGTGGVPVTGPATLSPMHPRSLAIDASGAVYAAGDNGFLMKLVPPSPAVPSAPSTVTAVPSYKQAVVSWVPPAAEGSEPVASYVVQYSTDGGSSWSSSTTASGSRATITGLTNGSGYEFRVAAVNSVGQGPWSAVSSSVTLPAPGSYVTVSPTRLLDTRIGLGAPGVKVSAGGTVHLLVDGQAGVPTSGVAAVVLNLTVTGPTGNGFVTAYADGTSMPNTSNLNYATGQTVPNLVVAPVGADGKVALTALTSSTHLVADVMGYYVAGAPVAGGYTAVASTRLLDTRDRTGVSTTTPVPADGTVTIPVTGRAGVPGSGVSAVLLNVAVTEPTGNGYVTVYPGGTSKPNASNLNYVKGETVSNLVLAPVGPDGNVVLSASHASTHLVADVEGYYTVGGSKKGTLSPIGPTRLLDTRSKVGVSTTIPVPAGGAVRLQVAGVAGIPTSVSAVVLNVTVTQPARNGFVTVYADGTAKPNSSNLNYVTNQTVPNLVFAPVGSDGKVDLWTASSTHVIADVAGYVR